MTGGYWESQNKVRPGAYINFETNEQKVNALDARGAVAIPLALNWGQTGTFIKVSPQSKFKELFGKALGDLKAIREAFKATSEVLVYNLSGASGVKATATSGTFIATAKYGGTGGNKISVTVTVGLDGSKTVKTFFDSEEVDLQSVATFAELVANAFVTFSGNLPAADATLTLVGGTTVAATNESHSACAAGLDTQNFKVVAVGTADNTVKALYALKVKEWRSQSGKNVTLVTNDYNTADHEGVVSVLNGVTLEGNEVLSASDALYWYAAAYANATTNSLTYAVYPGAIDCERKAHDEIVQALQDGHIIYTFNNDRVVIEQDINTFRSFTAEKNRDFRKNKIIRSMDIVSDKTQYVFSNFFIGNVNNDADGRNLFKGQIMKTVLDPYAKRGALQYAADDITIVQGVEKEALLVNAGILFNDSMEKLYMTVACK